MPNIQVPIHLQDTDNSCGPACVQMVARSFGAPLEEQATLAKLAKDVQKFADWKTSPDQLCDMLNDANRPAGAPATRYRVSAEVSASKVIQRAKASVDAGLPAVALVDEGTHWVVVRGYTTAGVRLRNPAPPRPQGLPSHNDGDDGCATLNEADGGEVGTSVDEYYSWSGWRRLCLTPCGFTRPARWLNQFIVVAADLLAPLGPIVAQPVVHVLGPHDPASLAVDGLKASGLLYADGWQESLSGITAASARGTLLVRETGGQSYYLVGLDGAAGNILAGVDATTGELLWAKLNPTPKLLTSLFSDLPTPGDPRMSAEVVWTPSRETFFSPFFPLMRFKNKSTEPDRPATYERPYDRQKISAPHSGPFSNFE